MDAISEYNKKYEFFKDITGEAMKIHRKWHSGLLESAYEAALKYLLEQKGFKLTKTTGSTSLSTTTSSWSSRP